MCCPGKFVWMWLFGGLIAVQFAVAAESPANKQAFLNHPIIYLSFEITETGTREFGAGTPKDALTDSAYRLNRRVTFEVPLDMAMPGSPPASSMPIDPMEMMEQGRFIGWMALPPDDPAAGEQLATGKIDLAKTPSFLPAQFSVDDVHQFRMRDRPTDGWGTETRVSKGQGTVYIGRSGMLMCDLKKMSCDINNVSLSGFHEDKDLVTVSNTSDVPGFEAKQETRAPAPQLPQPSAALVTKLSGFPITLPDPITLTFSGAPASPQGGEGDGSVITMKVTLSSKPQ